MLRAPLIYCLDGEQRPMNRLLLRTCGFGDACLKGVVVDIGIAIAVDSPWFNSVLLIIRAGG